MDNVISKYNFLKSRLHNHEYTEDEISLIREKFIDLYNDLILFLISKKDRYYGYIIMNFKLNLTFNEDIIAGVSIIEQSVFSLKINPLKILKYNLNEILFILCHEVEHLILLHPYEMIKLNPEKDKNKSLILNYAMDASINEYLKKDIEYGFKFLKLPEDCVTSNTIKNMAKINHINEDESFLYYYKLIKNLKIVKYLSFKDLEINDDFLCSANELEQKIKMFLMNSLKNMSEKSRNNLPYYQKRHLELIFNNPKINWKYVLKQYLGNIPDSFKKTKTRLNRRQPLRYDLCGNIKDYTLKLVVAVDTSASMSINTLNDIMNEIFNIVKKKKYEITMIEFDSEIRNISKLISKKSISNVLSGGGGTSYDSVVTYINENSYYRDSVLIWFTDGFGEESIIKPKVYKNLWVIKSDKNNLSLNNPYGKVMTLED